MCPLDSHAVDHAGSASSTRKDFNQRRHLSVGEWQSELSRAAIVHLSYMIPQNNTTCSGQVTTAVVSTQALSEYKDRLSRHGISIMKIRRSGNRLIFIMGIPLLVRCHLMALSYETAPWYYILSFFCVGLPITFEYVAWWHMVFMCCNFLCVKQSWIEIIIYHISETVCFVTLYTRVRTYEHHLYCTF